MSYRGAALFPIKEEFIGQPSVANSKSSFSFSVKLSHALLYRLTLILTAWRSYIQIFMIAWVSNAFSLVDFVTFFKSRVISIRGYPQHMTLIDGSLTVINSALLLAYFRLSPTWGSELSRATGWPRIGCIKPKTDRRFRPYLCVRGTNTLLTSWSNEESQNN